MEEYGGGLKFPECGMDELELVATGGGFEGGFDDPLFGGGLLGPLFGGGLLDPLDLEPPRLTLNKQGDTSNIIHLLGSRVSCGGLHRHRFKP